MGSMQAREMLDMVDNGIIKRKVALHWHLTANHYPPLPAALIPTAEAAIDAASAGNWEEAIIMPAGIEFRGEDHGTAYELIESMHLESFVDFQDPEC